MRLLLSLDKKSREGSCEIPPFGVENKNSQPLVTEVKGTPPRKILFVSESSGWPKVMAITPVPSPTGQYTRDVITKITQCLRISIELFSIYGFNSQGYSVQPTVHYLCALTNKVIRPDPWIDVMKYKIACLFAYENSLEMPSDDFGFNEPKDKQGILFHGRVRRWFRVLKRHEPEKFRSLMTSLSIGLKSGLPRPTKERVDYSVRKTIKKLFVSPQKSKDLVHLSFREKCHQQGVFVSAEAVHGKPSWARVGPIREASSSCRGKRAVTHSELIRQVRRTAREIFIGKVFGSKDINVFFPSTSANYIRSRSGGGSVLVVQDLLKEFFKDYELHTGKHPSLEEFNVSLEPYRFWHEFDSVEYEKEIKKSRLGNVPLGHERVHSGEFRQGVRYFVHDWTHLSAKFFEFYKFLILQCMKEDPTVSPIGLMEALKVRIITKCPPVLMYVVKPIQAWMAKVLREWTIFRLTGEPITERVISESIRREPGPGNKWLSGDYSAATDNLRKEFSDEVVSQISKCFRGDQLVSDEYMDYLRVLFQRSLTGFNIDINFLDKRKYLDNFGRMDDDDLASIVNGKLPQKDGQLMGSVTSFCVLCIINAALCRFCIELGYDRGFHLDDPDLNLLINGDDCVFIANDAVHLAWKWLGPRMGLEPSIGKYYYTDQFLQMNSRTFFPKRKPTVRCDPNGSSWLQDFILIRFVSMGLLKGGGRSCTDTLPNNFCKDVDRIMNLGDRYTENMKLAPGYTSVALHRRYRKILSTCFGGRLSSIPWYLPRWYGGLGLKPPGKLKISCSRMDLNRLNYALKEGIEIPILVTRDKWIMSRVMKKCITARSECDWSEEKDSSAQRLLNYLRFQMLNYTTSDQILDSDLTTGCPTEKAGWDFKIISRLVRFWNRKSLRVGKVKFARVHDPWQPPLKVSFAVEFNLIDETVFSRAY